MKSKYRKLAIAAALQSEITGTKWRWLLCRKSFSDSKEVPRIQFHHLDTINKTDYWFEWNPLTRDSDAMHLMAHLAKNDNCVFSFKDKKTTKEIRRSIVDQICNYWENTALPLDLKLDSYKSLRACLRDENKKDRK